MLTIFHSYSIPRVVEEEDIRCETTFKKIVQINDEYFILLSNGRIYKLSNIEEKALSDSMLSFNGNETCLMNESHLKNVSLNCITKTKFPKSVYSFCRVMTCDGELFVIAGEGFIYLVNAESDDSFTAIPYIKGFKRVTKIFNLDSFM